MGDKTGKLLFDGSKRKISTFITHIQTKNIVVSRFISAAIVLQIVEFDLVGKLSVLLLEIFDFRFIILQGIFIFIFCCR